MGEPIKIVITAQTAEAAAQLKAFVAQSGAALQELATGGRTAAGGLTELREGAMLTREGMRSLETSVFLLGGTRFPQLAMAMMGTSEAMRGIRTASLLTKIPLGEMGLIIGGIGAAVSAGYLVWKDYGGGMETAAEQAKKLADALEKIPDILKAITTAKLAGALGGDQAAKFQDYLSQKTPLYYVPGPKGDNDSDLTEDPSRMGSGREAGKRIANQQATLPQIKAYVQKLLEQSKVTNDNRLDPRIEAGADLQKDFQKSDEMSSDAVAKQKAEITARYQEEIDKINEDLVARGALATQADKATAALKIQNLQLAESADIAAAQQKIQSEAARAQAEAENKTREQYKQQFAEVNKGIEDQISEDADQAGLKRESLYQQEYVGRIVTAQEFFFTGKINEQEYAAAVESATKDMLAGQKAYNEQLLITEQLQRDAARSAAEVKLKQIESDPTLTKQQKDQKSVPAIQDLLSANQADIGAQQQVAAHTNDDAARAEALDKINNLLWEQIGLRNQLKAAQDDGSFTQSLMSKMVELQSQAGTIAHQIGEVFSNTIQGSIQTISDNITKVIEGTRRWSVALRDIGASILNSIISGLVQMVTRMIILAAVTAILKAAGATTTNSNSQAPADAAAWGAAGMARSIAEEGPIAGPIVFAAEMAASIPLSEGLASMGAQARYLGGPVTAGMPYIVGERGQELFVPQSHGTIIPAEQTSRLANGGGSGGPVTVKGHTLNAHFYDERPHPRDFLKSPEGEHLVVNIAQKNKTMIGIPS